MGLAAPQVGVNLRIAVIEEDGICSDLREGEIALQHEIDHLNGVPYVDRMYRQTFMTLENYKRAWKDVPIQEVRRRLTEPS